MDRFIEFFETNLGATRGRLLFAASVLLMVLLFPWEAAAAGVNQDIARDTLIWVRLGAWGVAAAALTVSVLTGRGEYAARASRIVLAVGCNLMVIQHAFLLADFWRPYVWGPLLFSVLTAAAQVPFMGASMALGLEAFAEREGPTE